MSNSKLANSGRYAYEGLDRIMHEKARLGILTSLLTHPEGVLFTDLKQLCSLTDGNLSRHLQALEEAGLVEVWKGFRNRKPQTLCRLSKAGREKFLAYLAELEKVLRDAAAKEVETEGTHPFPERGLPKGWAPV
jgi:DNA-binding transcriptional ArsR family regulator